MEHIMLGRKTDADKLEKDNCTMRNNKEHDASDGQRYAQVQLGKMLIGR